MQYASKYKKIKIQYRQAHGEWHDLSEVYTQTSIIPDITEVEVNHLILNSIYDFRGLFEDSDTGEIVHFHSKGGIAIKSNFCFKPYYFKIFW